MSCVINQQDLAPLFGVIKFSVVASPLALNKYFLADEYCIWEHHKNIPFR